MQRLSVGAKLFNLGRISVNSRVFIFENIFGLGSGSYFGGTLSVVARGIPVSWEVCWLVPGICFGMYSMSVRTSVFVVCFCASFYGTYKRGVLH